MGLRCFSRWWRGLVGLFWAAQRQRRLGRWVLMVVLVAGASGGCQGEGDGQRAIESVLPTPIAVNSPAGSSSAVSFPNPTQPPAVVATIPPLAPSLDPDRLWSTLQALPTPRHDLQDRRQARQWLTEQLRDRGWQVSEQAFSGGVNLVARRSGSPGAALSLAARLPADADPQDVTRPAASPATSSANNSVTRSVPSPAILNSADRGIDRPKILVAAHYDTVAGSPGFNDNGTGTAGLLEIAALFSESQTENYPKSLELVFFDLEEQGLQGSFAYTQSFENLANLDGVMVLDMLGYGCQEAGCQTYPEGLPKAFLPSDRGNFVAIVGDAEHDTLLDAFDALPASPEFFVYTLAVPLKGILTPDVLRSDHAPFWLHNIGAVLVTDTGNLRNPHYHQPSDTLENLDRAFFERSLQASITALHQWLSTPTP